MRKKVAGFIAQEQLLNEGQPLLVAISGGPDSVALAHILRSLGYVIELAHVNYGLRGPESEADENLVRHLARQWQVPLHLHREKPDKQEASVQVSARRIRYHFFEKILVQGQLTHCATAHHADDQVENLLMTLIRGNSPEVFKGLPVKRGAFVRPLLSCTKSEILDYLEKYQVPYREDHTNLQTDYLRNQFRLQLLPELEKLNPNFRAQLVSRFQLYQQQSSFLKKVLQPLYQNAEEIHDGVKKLDWKPFVESYGEEFLPLFVSRVLTGWGLHGQDLWAALDLIESLPGKLALTQRGKIVRTRTGLSLIEETQPASFELKIGPEDLPKKVKFGSRKVYLGWTDDRPKFSNENVHHLDGDKLHWPLKIRNWHSGDRMIPLGMDGSKKLSDIFIDEKFSYAAKHRAVVIEDGHQIVLLSDFRIADPVKITPKTRRILLIRFDS